MFPPQFVAVQYHGCVFFISSAPCRGVNDDVEANFFLRGIVPLTLRITSCILRAYGSRPGREPPGGKGWSSAVGRDGLSLLETQLKAVVLKGACNPTGDSPLGEVLDPEVAHPC